LIERAIAEIWPEVDLLVGAPGLGIAIDSDAILVTREKIRAVGHAMDWVVSSKRAVERKGIVEKAPLDPLQVEGERRSSQRGIIGGPLSRAFAHIRSLGCFSVSEKYRGLGAMAGSPA